jgi:hypothetical protein
MPEQIELTAAHSCSQSITILSKSSPSFGCSVTGHNLSLLLPPPGTMDLNEDRLNTVRLAYHTFHERVLTALRTMLGETLA